jgi:O-acetyl-ADP-ribose deacetylase (regulator of RNase III)
MKINGVQVEVVRGAVQEQDADAIVNAANTKMRGGGGVDGAIHRAAGPALLEELRRAAPRGSKTAEVVATRGHNLPHKFILHVAGPIYNRHSPSEAARLLAACYTGCLEASDERALESIAFPSISTGAYGFPLESAAPLVLNAISKYLRGNPSTSLKKITLAMFARQEFEVFQSALQNLEGRDQNAPADAAPHAPHSNDANYTDSLSEWSSAS